MTRVIFSSMLVFIVTFLSACGGGGGGTSTPPPQSKTFSLSVESIEINRVSNSDAIVVDTSALTSGDLNYNPN